MYLIDKEKNRISKLRRQTFAELRFREREHLQEWMANNPMDWLEVRRHDCNKPRRLKSAIAA